MEGIKMKDSGIKWIGNIPGNWNIKRLKYCVRKKITDGPHETPVFVDDGVIFLSVDSIQDGKIVFENTRFISCEDAKRYDKKCKLEKNDVLIGKAASTGKIAIVDKDVYFQVWSPLAIVKTHNKILDSNFLRYYLLSPAGQENIDNFCTMNTQKNIAMEDIERLSIVIPTLQEQLKIAGFLDKKCADIDEIISKTEKQIEILEQYKKSLITETVTKGLKNSKLINSDIKWIGEIPFDWNTKKIKYVATLKGRIGWQGLTSDEYQDEGPYLITGVDFLDGQINWENCVHIPEKRWTEAVDIRIKENDLLVTKDGTVGKVALVKNLKDKASLNSGVLLINLEEEYDKKYLFWVLKSDIFWKWFSYTNSGNSTIIHLYQHDFDNFEYPIPPMKEQKEIAAFLDMKCEKTDKIIQQQKESLETLKKYKQSLIYEYVTGKKRV